MALEEPTVSEIIRDVQAAVNSIDARTQRIEEGMALYVPRELYDRDQKNVEQRLTSLESKGRQWWTLFALPAMVGLFIWVFPRLVE